MSESSEFRVEGSEFGGVEGLVSRVWGSAGSGYRAQGLEALGLYDVTLTANPCDATDARHVRLVPGMSQAMRCTACIGLRTIKLLSSYT